MSTPVLIKLITAGSNTGPFNLYTDIDLGTPIEIGVSREMLLTGHTLYVPNGATYVKIISIGDCETQTIITINYSTPTPTPTSTPTPTPTPTITSTPTVTPTPTVTSTPTPTPTITPIPCDGIPYRLTNLYYKNPRIGDVIFSDFTTQTPSNNPDGIENYGGIYWNITDANGVNRLSYFTNIVGQNILLKICQNNVTATYQGSYSFVIDSTPTGYVVFFENLSRQLTQIDLANTLFNFNQIVYIDYEVL
jgi:hypothetical protein